MTNFFNRKTPILAALGIGAALMCGAQAQAQQYPGVLAPAPDAQGAYAQPATNGGQAASVNQQIDNVNTGPADVGPAVDPESSFSGMFASDGGTSLNDFINNQDDSSNTQESKREAAIVKAAVEKQRAIQAANIAQRKAEERAVQQAARAANKVGEEDDDTQGGDGFYTADGGDNGDGYYGPLDSGNQ